ncbi:MAG: hypothetical protein RL664_589, partial [Bacteroidota bacterium]
LKYYSNNEMKYSNVGYLSKDELKVKLVL